MSLMHKNYVNISMRGLQGQSRLYLWNRAERLQIAGHANPEDAQTVQTEGDGDIINDTAPEVSTLQPNISLLIRARRLHSNGCNGKRQLQPRILQNSALDRKKRMRITDIHLRKQMVHRPHMLLRRPPMHHDYQRPLPTQKVDEQLEESVNCERLVHIPDRLDELGRFKVD